MKSYKIYSFGLFLGALTLYACGGSEQKPAVTTTPETAVKETPATGTEASAAGTLGEEVYKKTCIACHQANGEGIANTFPPLAKSDFLANRADVIQQVIKGKTGEMTVNGVKYNGTMPPQALSDEEIASVLNYVYTSWGNSGAAFTVDEVKAQRDKI